MSARDNIQSTLFILLVFAVISTNSHDCFESDCISLFDCPSLMNLLRRPTFNNIRKVQEATCFIEDNVPMVCCPKKEIKIPTKSLLPVKRGACGVGKADGLLRIIGGNQVPLGAYPWIAALGYTEPGFDTVAYHCAGSIINERYILTAAHCVAPEILKVKKLKVITVGEWDLTTERDCLFNETNGVEFCAPPAQNFTIEEIIIHETYNQRAIHSDDIALIRLSTPLDLSGPWVHPICLPPQGLNTRRIIGDDLVFVAGWGTTETSRGSDQLLDVLVPIANTKICNETYGGVVLDEQICFGGVAGKDSCAGDSGGPVVMGGPPGDKPPFLLVGIVSYGPSTCGMESVPGVYTSVSHYRKWIESKLRP